MNPTDAAFPFYATDNEGRTVQNSGMDIRTYAAIQIAGHIGAVIHSNKVTAQATQKVAKDEGLKTTDLVAALSLELTDALLSQLSKQPK